MKRSLSFERTIPIGQYNMVKIFDGFIEVPEEFALNPEFAHRVRLLQMAEVEKAYRKYLLIKDQLDKLELNEALEKIEEIRIQMHTELKEMLEGDK